VRNAKQELETQTFPQWDWVETVVWTERMLAALSNGVKGNKWFSLWDKVYRPKTLKRAWEIVRKNHGAKGIDGVTIERYETQVDKYLEELYLDLKENKYKPDAARRVHIPKVGGGKRPLGIASVKDRIVQTALKITLEPIFEKEFLPNSYGFRPNIGAKDALREVDRLLKEGYIWVVDADVEKYFDSIPKMPLISRIEERIADGRVLELIEQFLNQGIMEEGKEWTPSAGTPQGAVCSSLFANVYLHSLDQYMLQEGMRMIRYADDFVVLCRTEAEAQAALAKVKQWMDRNGLSLHPEKTRIGNCMIPGEGFEFLGYRFEVGRRLVRKSSMRKLCDTIRQRTKRTVGKSMEAVIETLNPTLRGWFEYFKHANKSTFKRIDGFIRRRLRAIMRKQEKRPGRGRCLNDHMRWPNKFFAMHGLFTMTEARAELASQSR
jgi:RNA-directed DNA polymerase